MRVKLTRKAVAGAVAPAGGRSLQLWDVDLRGFGLRVRGASKVYVIRYGTGRRHHSRWVTIGPHGGPWRPDPNTGAPRILTAELAREEATRLLGLRAAGQDPGAARQAALTIPTLAAFAPRYLAEWSAIEKAPASMVKDRSNLEAHLLPTLGQIRLDRIGPEHLASLKREMRRTPIAFNRCLALLSHMLRMARTWRVLPAGTPNPCEDVPRFEERRRDRALVEHELARVGAILAAAEAAWRLPREERAEGAVVVSPVAAAAIRALLFTGARPVELLGLRRDGLEAALAAGVIVRPSLKVGRRRRRQRPVILNSYAVAVLRAAPTRPGNPYVFPGARPGRPLTIFALDEAWARVRRAARLPDDVRLYDASRHTYGTTAAETELLAHVQALLGHSSSKTTERYVHLPEDPLRAAAERTGKKLSEALGATPTDTRRTAP